MFPWQLWCEYYSLDITVFKGQLDATHKCRDNFLPVALRGGKGVVWEEHTERERVCVLLRKQKKVDEGGNCGKEDTWLGGEEREGGGEEREGGGRWWEVEIGHQKTIYRSNLLVFSSSSYHCSDKVRVQSRHSHLPSPTLHFSGAFHFYKATKFYRDPIPTSALVERAMSVVTQLLVYCMHIRDLNYTPPWHALEGLLFRSQ